MKKVMILTVVAALLGISAPNVFAQVPGSSQPSPTEMEERDLDKASDAVDEAIENLYTEEVKIEELPAAVTRSLNEKHPGYKTEKVFLGKDGTYKVKVSKGDEKQVLFFDARGEAIKRTVKQK